MNAEPEITAFVKAMSSVERLRVIGALVRGRATQAEIADQLHLPAREAFQHLSFLLQAGIVREEQGFYALNEKTVETLARRQFEGTRSAYETGDEKPEDVRKVLKTYLNADGTLKQLPQEGRKMGIVLHYILEAFPPGATFTEKEVNAILRRFHVDTATLRRNLIDYGLMARAGNGSKYWRLSEPLPPLERGAR